MRLNRLTALIVASLSTSLLSTAIFAKQVPLFEEPQDKAKIVGTIDLAAGVIPIFTPKGSDWVKVADPRNGHVGWIRSKDLANGSSFSFSTKVVNDEGKSGGSYQLFQFGNSTQNTKEMDAQLKKLQAQQYEIQKSMNKSIQNMVNDMNQIYQEYSNTMNSMGMPIIMPVMLVPVQKKSGEAGKMEKLVPPKQEQQPNQKK